MKNIRIIVFTVALAASAPTAWSQNSGSGGSGSFGGSGSGAAGTGVDSAVQSYGESSGKTSGGLAAGLEDAFGGLTVEDGQGVGDPVSPEFALLGDLDADGDYVIYTIADTGQPVKIVVHRMKIVSIEPSGPIPVIQPSTYACGRTA